MPSWRRGDEDVASLEVPPAALEGHLADPAADVVFGELRQSGHLLLQLLELLIPPNALEWTLQRLSDYVVGSPRWSLSRGSTRIPASSIMIRLGRKAQASRSRLASQPGLVQFILQGAQPTVLLSQVGDEGLPGLRFA